MFAQIVIDVDCAVYLAVYVSFTVILFIPVSEIPLKVIELFAGARAFADADAGHSLVTEAALFPYELYDFAGAADLLPPFQVPEHHRNELADGNGQVAGPEAVSPVVRLGEQLQRKRVDVVLPFVRARFGFDHDRDIVHAD